MHKFAQRFSSLLMSAALFGLAGLSGCAARGSVRYYDPVYGEYHPWNHREIIYYRQWENETHRHDRDFHNRSRQEQNEYWRWRDQYYRHDHDRH
jgi:hypothetical protein